MATASWADGIANSRRGSTEKEEAEKEGGDKGEEILDARASPLVLRRRLPCLFELSA